MHEYRLDNSKFYILMNGAKVDFYEFLELDVNATKEEIENKIKAKANSWKFAKEMGYTSNDKLFLEATALEKVEDTLLNDTLRDIYNKRTGLVKESKETIRMKFQRQHPAVKIIAGLAALIALFEAGKITADEVHDYIDTYNSNHNTIIEMVIPEGMDMKTVSANFDDWGYSNLEVQEQNREDGKVYAGDSIIGLTTTETAEKLEENYNAKNIGIDEAVEKLAATDTLRGEFKNYVDGDRDFEFNTPNLTLDGKKDKDANVCVKFTVPMGATRKDIKNHFKDFGLVKMLVVGPNRDMDTIYAGEVYVARTTIDIAENLKNWQVEEISLEEAIELQSEASTLNGKFKDASLGKTDFEFREFQVSKS